MEAGLPISADLIRLTYEGVLRREAWREMLALACEAFRAKDTYLASVSLKESGTRFVLTHGVDPAVEKAYRDQWIAPPRNPVLTPLARVRFRGVIEPREVVPRATFEKTEFYEVCRRPRGVDAELGCGDVGAAGRIRFMTANRARGDPGFSEPDKRLMELLCPHVLKALEVDAHLAEERAKAACLGCALEGLDDPVVRREPDGRLRALNRSGEEFLRSEGFGTWDGSAFLPRDPRPTILAGAPTPAAGSAGDERRFRSGVVWRVFSVPCFEGDRYLGEVLRFRVAQPCRKGVDPGEPEPDLTHQEEVVLALLSEGLSSQEVCDRLGISTNTLNTHVRHILGKTGCHSRTQVVARYGRSGRGEPGPVSTSGEAVYRD